MKGAMLSLRKLSQAHRAIAAVLVLFVAGGCEHSDSNAARASSASAVAASSAPPETSARYPSPGSKRTAGAGAPLTQQGPKPKRCRLDEVGGIRFEITLTGDLAKRDATRAALATRAAQLNPNCRSFLRDTPQGVDVEVFDLRALASTTPRALTEPGEVWVAPWSTEVPKPDAVVQRPKKSAVVLEVVSSELRAKLSEGGASGGAKDIVMKFAPESAAAFGELSGRHVGETLVIGYDDRVLAAPKVTERIDGGEVRIALGPSRVQGAERLAKLLSRPALPGPVRLTNMHQVGPTKPRRQQ